MTWRGNAYDYSAEVFNVLVAEMENLRDDLVVIAAGYGAELHTFLQANPGLEGRFSYTLNTPNYNAEELREAFEKIVADNSLQLDESARAGLPRAISAIPQRRSFANARGMRKLFETALVRQAARVADQPDADLRVLTVDDILGARAVSRGAQAPVGPLWRS